jgi:hypothetical protein
VHLDLGIAVPAPLAIRGVCRWEEQKLGRGSRTHELSERSKTSQPSRVFGNLSLGISLSAFLGRFQSLLTQPHENASRTYPSRL